MPACLRCGKKIDTDFFLWKGGESQSWCDSCLQDERMEAELKSMEAELNKKKDKLNINNGNA